MSASKECLRGSCFCLCWKEAPADKRVNCRFLYGIHGNALCRAGASPLDEAQGKAKGLLRKDEGRLSEERTRRNRKRLFRRKRLSPLQKRRGRNGSCPLVIDSMDQPIHGSSGAPCHSAYHCGSLWSSFSLGTRHHRTSFSLFMVPA